MTKTIHILVSVLFAEFAAGLWLLLFSAEQVFALRSQPGDTIHDHTSILLNHRHYLFILAALAVAWSVYILRRPVVSIESGFVYFLIVAIVSICLLTIIGIGMIHSGIPSYF